MRIVVVQGVRQSTTEYKNENGACPSDLWRYNLLWLREIVKEGVNKSNHPIQNPLLLVTEPRTRDNIYEREASLNLKWQLDSVGNGSATFHTIFTLFDRNLNFDIELIYWLLKYIAFRLNLIAITR
jgi:hypothetical protein